MTEEATLLTSSADLRMKFCLCGILRVPLLVVGMLRLGVHRCFHLLLWDLSFWFLPIKLASLEEKLQNRCI